MTLENNDEVINQHGISGIVITTKWNISSPYQVIDEYGKYHSEIRTDGTSGIGKSIWRLKLVQENLCGIAV